MSAKDDRAQRLAAELRANLHRRKAQARGIAGAPSPVLDIVPPKADDDDRPAG